MMIYVDHKIMIKRPFREILQHINDQEPTVKNKDGVRGHSYRKLREETISIAYILVLTF